MAVILNRIGNIEYLTAEGIPVPHCFTTRLGGVSQGQFSSMNIGILRGDNPEHVAENFRILGDVVGFSLDDLVSTRQSQSDIIWQVGRAQRGTALTKGSSPECDALITNEPDTGLVIYTADCTPILLHDPVTGAVGAAHAGWRGTVADIAGKTARAMIEAYGCKPEDIRAAIGPNIGPCHFETHRDVPDAALATFGEAAQSCIRPAGDKFYVNLKELNALALRRVGITHIEISEDCTMCLPNRYWSQRANGYQRGNQGAIILCKGGNQ